MKKLRSLIIVICIFAYSLSNAATYLSNSDGVWGTTTIWTENGNPMPAGDDDVIIRHEVTYNGSGVGVVLADGSTNGDLGVANGKTITIDGGALIRNSNNHIRIGNKTLGTLDIKNGSAYLSGSNFNVGTELAGAVGIIKVGDGTGEAGSAVLNLRQTYGLLNPANPTGPKGLLDNAETTALNLGNIAGTSGVITIESDGLLESDTSGTVRIGRYSNAVDGPQSAIYVKAGGKMKLNGAIEIGANAGADALLSLNGVGAAVTQNLGEFTLGYSALGTMIIENSAQYTRESGTSGNLFIGRNNGGNGTLSIRSNGKFIRASGGSVGDLMIGSNGTGTVTLSDGGELINSSGNWDWIGRYATGKGYVYVNEGGKYTVNGGGSLQIGTLAGAVGLLEVNGGSLEMTAGGLFIGYNGTGTFKQTSGTTSLVKITMAAASGTGTFELSGGSLNVSTFYLGGNTGGGTYGGDTTIGGTASATQSGGTVNNAGALVIGLFAKHTGTYTMSSGTYNHTASDVTVGENGSGTLTIGKTAVFNATGDSRQFYVGRNNDSNGALIVDGALIKDSGLYGIRVGNGDSAGTNNTNGRGLLGGTGTITARNGVDIGAYGTITAGTKTTVGELTINGNLDLIGTSASKSTLFINFDSSTLLGADRINLFGELNVENAILDGKWLSGNDTGIDSRYWVVTRNGSDLWGVFSNAYYESTNLLADEYYALGADGFVMIDNQEFAMFYNGDFMSNSLTGGSDFVLSAMGSVPEPSHTLLCLFGLTALLMRRCRLKGASR